MHTDTELSLTLKQFMSMIGQFSVLSQTLGTKIEGLNSRFDDMEHRLESIEHRLDSMVHRIESLEDSMARLHQETECLEARFKTINEYLLEVIRREQTVMQELGELASRYHEQDI